MDELQSQKLIEALEKLHAVLRVLRNDIHWEEFTFVMGSAQPATVQAQQCWIDKIHNPNTNGNVNVTLAENGQTKYAMTLAPGSTEPLGFRFYRECVLTTDGNAVTIHGRIRA